MPVVHGAALVFVTAGTRFDLIRFGLALVAMVLLHSGAKVFNDVADFRQDVDRDPKPGSGAMVQGRLSPAQALGLGWRAVRGRPEDPAALDAATAQLALSFDLLATAALLPHALIGWLR